MVCPECKGCHKYLTNDCQGSPELSKDACQQVIKNRSKEIDVSGCC